MLCTVTTELNGFISAEQLSGVLESPTLDGIVFATDELEGVLDEISLQGEANTDTLTGVQGC